MAGSTACMRKRHSWHDNIQFGKGAEKSLHQLRTTPLQESMTCQFPNIQLRSCMQHMPCAHDLPAIPYSGAGFHAARCSVQLRSWNVSNADHSNNSILVRNKGRRRGASARVLNTNSVTGYIQFASIDCPSKYKWEQDGAQLPKATASSSLLVGSFTLNALPAQGQGAQHLSQVPLS